MSAATAAVTSATGVGERLTTELFERSVHEVAPELIGCTLLVDGVGGVIVETESYDRDDPACHAYRGRTERNAALFGPPARAYVYLSYGIHCLLNFVCEPEGRAAAVLIRALEPKTGIDRMRARRGRPELHQLCSGPGKLGEALGIDLGLDGVSLAEPPFELFARSNEQAPPQIVAGPRVGISQGTELPWRYCAAGSRFASRPLPAPAS